jgi:hypothetical protein
MKYSGKRNHKKQRCFQNKWRIAGENRVIRGDELKENGIPPDERKSEPIDFKNFNRYNRY